MYKFVSLEKRPLILPNLGSVSGSGPRSLQCQHEENHLQNRKDQKKQRWENRNLQTIKLPNIVNHVLLEYLHLKCDKQVSEGAT